MRSSFGGRRFNRRHVFFRLGGSGRLVLGSALVAMLLVSVMVPAMRPGRASAGECPPGQIKEGSGLLAHCVPMIDPGNIDLGIGDGSIEDGAGGVEAGDPAPQPTPVVIDVDPEVEENPSIDPPAGGIDVEPENPTIDLNGLPILLPDGPFISIVKSQCPEGFDAYAADQYELAYNCNVTQSGVKFLVSDGGSKVFQRTTDQNGAVEFSYLPVGPLSVVEQVPAGYGEPVVYCKSFILVKGNVLETPWERMTIDAGNQFFHVYDVAESLYCTWYNVPSSEAGDGGTFQLTPVVSGQIEPVENVPHQLTPVVFEPEATPTPQN